MTRELTVILKQPPEAPRSFGSQVLNFVNETVRSPLFVFVFGASLGTVYPALKDWLTPASELASRHAQEQAKADAVLIAPFIGSLDASKPGQFEAARAALLALEATAAAADDGRRPAVYEAVNKAIEAVATQLRPPTDKTQLSTEVNQQIAATAQRVPAQAAAAAAPPQLDQLSKDTVVYLQVGRDSASGQRLADDTQKALRAASVLAPGIEKVADTALPQRTQVRYFFDSDKSKAAQLAAVVAGIVGGEVLLAKPNLSAKPGTLEVWFANERGGG